MPVTELYQILRLLAFICQCPPKVYSTLEQNLCTDFIHIYFHYRQGSFHHVQLKSFFLTRHFQNHQYHNTSSNFIILQYTAIYYTHNKTKSYMKEGTLLMCLMYLYLTRERHDTEKHEYIGGFDWYCKA